MVEDANGPQSGRISIEAIDWAMERRIAEPEAEVEEKRKNEISNLQILRDRISKSGKPAKTNKMHPMVTNDVFY